MADEHMKVKKGMKPDERAKWRWTTETVRSYCLDYSNNATRRVPTRQRSNTEHSNGAQSTAHLRVLAPPSVFAGVANEPTAIMSEPQIEVLQEEVERDDSASRELVWLLDLPGQVTPRWLPQLLLCEPNIEDEQELRFVQTHGVGLLEVGVCIDESGGKRGWSDTPFRRVAWIPI
jgi:hypothetical protein